MIPRAPSVLRASGLACALVTAWCFNVVEVEGRTIAARVVGAQSLPKESYRDDTVDEQAEELWSEQRYHKSPGGFGHERTRRDAGPYAPLRVHFELLSNVPSALRERLDIDVVPWVQERLAESISVVRVVGNLSLTSPTAGSVWCGQQSAVIPEWHLSRSGLGVSSTDTIVYVAGISCGASSGTLAYSATCFRDQQDRPIAGLVNMCERTHNMTTIDIDTTRTLLLHEVIHVLGFAHASYRYYRNCAGGSTAPDGTFVCSPRVPRDGSGQPIVGTTGDVPGVVRVMDGVPHVHTPAVVAAARRYFGCATLSDVPLEDEGSGASLGQHWEARVLAYDVMTSQITVGLGSRYFVSDMTLALLNDSGWYQTSPPALIITENEAGQWGRDEGCGFLACANSQQTTSTTAATRTPPVAACCSGSTFCDADGSYGCSHDSMDKARCNTSSFMNGCMSFLAVGGGSCADMTNTARNGEVYGVASRCFVAERPGRAGEGRCLRHRCIHGRLLVGVSPGQYEACDIQGHNLITSYANVTCPRASALCGEAPNTTQRARQTLSIQFESTGQTTSDSLYDNVSTSLESSVIDLLGNPPLCDVTVLSVVADTDRVIAVVEIRAANNATSSSSTRTGDLLALLDAAVGNQLVFIDIAGARTVAKPYSGDDGQDTPETSVSGRLVTGVVTFIASVVLLVIVVATIAALRRRHRQSSVALNHVGVAHSSNAVVQNVVLQSQDVSLEVVESRDLTADGNTCRAPSALSPEHMNTEWEEPPEVQHSASGVTIRWGEPPLRAMNQVTEF